MASENVVNGGATSVELILSSEVSEERKNKRSMKCLRCPSTILKNDMADLKEIQFSLPDMRKKREANAEGNGVETLHHFWLVPDMYMFENVGFSNTVDNVKYLTCADCEVGPIGWHNLDTKQCYVALNRVKYTS